MSVVFFSDICSPSSGYLTLVWRNPCWELRHPAFTIVFKVVWCSRKRFGPLKNLNLAKDDSGAITSAKYVNPDSFFDYWHFGILTAQLGKKSSLFIGKSKTDTHFSRRAQIHMHTQQDGPLSISLPPPCVSEGLAGLENRCQISFHLLCYQHSNVLLQENICLSIDHQQRGPTNWLICTLKLARLCHSNCKDILSPARFLSLLLLAQQH